MLIKYLSFDELSTTKPKIIGRYIFFSVKTIVFFFSANYYLKLHNWTDKSSRFEPSLLCPKKNIKFIQYFDSCYIFWLKPDDIRILAESIYEFQVVLLKGHRSIYLKKIQFFI